MRQAGGSAIALSRATAAVLVLVFLAGIAFRYGDIVRNGAQYDDSYITYRYAIRLSEGQGLVFNNYERVNSASSLLYTGLLALVHRSGVHDLERVAATVNAVAGSAALLLAFATAVAASGSVLVAFILLFPIALSGAWTGWAASGMDTVFYGFTVVGFIWAYASGRRAMALLFLVACLLTRPEGVLIWTAAIAAELLAVPRDGRWLTAYAATGAIVLASIHGFYFIYYGDWVPQPLRLKSVSVYYAPGMAAQVRAVAGFLIGSFGALTIPAAWAVWRTLEQAIVSRLRRRRAEGNDGVWCRVSRLELFLAAFLALSAVSFVLGPRSDLVRYATHVLPVLAIAVATIWPEVRARLPRTAGAAMGAALLVVALVQVKGESDRARSAFHEWAPHQAARKELGRWLETHAPKGALVLSSDLGAVAYAAMSHDFYDALGLLSRVPLLAARRDRWDDVIHDLERLRPQYLVDTVTPDGKIQSLRVLEEPERSFRTVTPDPSRRSGCRVRILQERSAGPYRFVVARLAWTTPSPASSSGPPRRPAPTPRPSR